MTTSRLRRSAAIVATTALLLAAELALRCPTATAQPMSRPADPGFSFAVYGDSRSMMYLPYKSDQEADARQLMVDIFDLVLPEKVSEEVVQKYVKLTYDPATKELVQIVNPHKVIASNAKDLDIVVFNGHVHTTEVYDVDGVKYLLRGGGGAGQDPILPGRTSIRVLADYPPDLYWKGQPPKEEYNYLLVDVQPGQKTKFTLNRFRRWSAEPFATVELFK